MAVAPLAVITCRELSAWLASYPETRGSVKSLFRTSPLNVVLFIRGLPGCSEELKSANSLVVIKNHLSAKEINEAILQSDMIISRCGYTTVMDLIKLQKRAILIPTPGQTEQEYLAEYLMENNLFYTINQKDFALQSSLQKVQLFSFTGNKYNMEQYKSSICQFVQLL